jgi:pyruvate/2-oxoglutarate dehydrogenase complex dihydrolipoamide dehydrogenase (E3) component
MEVPGFEFGGGRVLSSRHALALDSVPEGLVVVGAGYIGMELSTVFAKAGADVTVVEMLEDVLPGFDPDLARPVKKRAEALGVEFHFGQAASEWRPAAEAEAGNPGDGIVVVTEDEDGETYEHEAEKVLVAVGRGPGSAVGARALQEAGVAEGPLGGGGVVLDHPHGGVARLGEGQRHAEGSAAVVGRDRGPDPRVLQVTPGHLGQMAMGEGRDHDRPVRSRAAHR